MVNNENRWYKRIIPLSGKGCEENETGGGGGERVGSRVEVMNRERWWALSSVGSLEPRNPGVQCTVPSTLLTVRITLFRAAVWCWRSLGFRATVPRRLQCTVSEPVNTSRACCPIKHSHRQILWEVFYCSFLHADSNRVTNQEGLLFSLNCPTDGGGCSLYSGDWLHPSHNFNCT